MRVIGYARISRASDDSTSLAKQRQIIEQTAAARGWELVRVVEDEDVSATKSRLNRPGLTAARDAIAAREADALLVWRLDRLARSVVDFGLLLDEGVEVISATEPLDTTTPMGKAMAQIIQVFAELESRTTGERARATKAYLRAMRRWGGGPRPYGYRPVKADDGIGKVLVIDEDEAAVIRRIFAELLDGASVNGLARKLNAEGIPTVTGKSWKPASVLNIARALHVCGWLTREVERSSRERRPVLDENGEPIVAWEPIVDAETAAKVRELVSREALDEKRSAATKAGLAGANKRLLSGLALCPCGEKLLTRTRRGRAFYGCRGIAEGSHVLVDAELVDAEAERQFLASFSGVEVVERVVEVSTSEALANVERELAAAQAEIMSASTSELPQLFERIAALTAEREKLAETDDRVTTKRTFRSYGESWESWDVHARREQLAALGATVRILPAARRGHFDPSRVVLDVELDYLAGQLD